MKKFILFCILYFSLFSAVANDFYIEPKIISSFGQVNEIIYSGFAEEKYASLLEWNFIPVVHAGFGAGYESKYFFASLSGAVGIPGECGSMHDSDFIQPAEIKNIFSPFKLNLVQRYLFIVDLKGSVPIKKIALNFNGQVYYDYTEFLATEGCSYYSNNNWWYFCDVKYYPQGKVNNIGFAYHIFFVFAGLGIEFNPSQNLKFSADFFVNPFAFFSSMDDHYWKKNKQIKHSFNGVQYSNFERWKFSLGAQYKLSEKFVLNFNGTGTWGSAVQGNLWTDYDSDYFYKSKQKSGSSIIEFDFSTGLKILFTNKI